MLSLLISVLAFLVVFSLIILIHELGHFLAAKKAGIKVEEFGLGLPPKMFAKKVGETVYTFNWIPFGGFVKLLGQDDAPKKLIGSSRSFADKPLSDRIKVTIGGIFMNFLLAVVLLSIGFTMGIKPLIVGEDDVYSYINNGHLKIQSGVVIKEIEEDSLSEKQGLKKGDLILSVNGREQFMPDILIDRKDRKDLKILSEGEVKMVSFEEGDEKLGISFYQLMSLPRLVIHDLKNFSVSAGSGFKRGDTLLTVNGKQIYFLEDLRVSLDKQQEVELFVYREGLEKKLKMIYPKMRETVINDVITSSPADKAGFKVGDVLLKVGKKEIYTPGDLSGVISAKKGEEIRIQVLRSLETSELKPISKKELNDVVEGEDAKEFTVATESMRSGGLLGSEDYKEIKEPRVLRGQSALIEQEGEAGLQTKGKTVILTVIPDENGLIGIAYSGIVRADKQGFDLYQAYVTSSVVEIKDVKLKFGSAVLESFKETGRLSYLTVKMFGNVVTTLVSEFKVPNGVAGPVGIAKMTHSQVQEGMWALLRFVAILSISIGVLNLLPFPALDGGRLFFLLIELVSGKRINHKWESIIHSFGFILLMALIVVITWNDIVTIFK